MSEPLDPGGPALAAAHRYFDAWNRRDPDAVAATFADGGTYTDPATGGDLVGPAIAAHAAALFAGFPDLSFEIVSDGATGPGTVAAEWLMRGTNTGSLRGAPPTGATVALPGADAIVVEDGLIRSVRGYFDRQTMLEQLGLKVVAQPAAAGPVSFGTSVHMQLDRPTPPRAVSLTWIDARSEEEAVEIQTAARRILPELRGVPGFLSALLARAGDRLFTVTAWEDAGAAAGLLRSPVHRSVMQRFFRSQLGAAAHTGVWVPERLNAVWVRCPRCGEMIDGNRAEGVCQCGTTLPRPPAW
jgi:steroid delta-isomerase-like uncharacterized protein